jgi:hypothetical protein
MSTSTTGTGTITLGSAENGYQSFDDAGVPDGDVVRYVIEDGANWEVGTGTYTASGTTLTRTVTESSNSDAALNLSGNAVVFIGPAAQDFSPTITLAGDASGSVTLTDLEDATLTVTVADDSHNHVIANVDGLQADLDAKLDKSGGTMTGNLILNADPTTALGAATKEYVDTIAAAGIHYHDPVRVEQEGNLTATYDNGTAGVGATLTNSGSQAALVIDGVTMVLNDRVLVYEQTNAYENGIYTVTNVGSASTNWVLTRATDADSYGASDPDALGQGDAFFVQEGNVGAGELYVMNTEGSITFGTTGITFTQIQSTAVYSAGTDLTLSGTTFNVNSTISADTTGNAATATALETARTIGGVSFDGTANINLAGVNTTGNQDTTGNAATATAWETARTVTLSGDVSGTATGVDGSGNVSITTTVADDSHAHVISNVDGLQTALDAKAPTASPTFSGTITFPAGQTFDGRDVSADGSKLDGIESGATADQTKADIDALGIAASTASTLATARNIAVTGAVTGNANFDGSGNISISTTATSDPTLTLSGDASGSATFTNLGNATLTVTVADDSHNHVISNIDGLQSALDGKQASGTYNTIIGTDTDINTSGSTIIDNIFVTDGVITSMGTRTLTLGDLGYTGETNATADQTASEILTAVKTVDGSGSGLDADTVDGLQASSFVRSDANDTMNGKYTIVYSLGVGNATAGSTFDNGKAIAIGDSDTGIRQDGDGELELWANNQEILHINTSQVSSVKPLNMNGQNLTNVEDIYLRDKLLHDGDNNTYLGFGTDSISLVTGGTGRLTLSNTGTAVSNGALDMNGNYITEVEGIYLRDKLYHDGDTDTYLGFGTNTIDLYCGNTREFFVNGNGVFIEAALREDYDALSGTSPTANTNNGGAFSLTMTGNTTFTFSAPVTGYSTGFVLQLTGNGGTVTWPSSVDWAGGTAPDAPASGETDLLVFWTRDGGTTWYGMLAIDAAA